MRAAPACQVVLQRFGVWHAAVFASAALGMAAITAWALVSGHSVEAPTRLVVGLGTALVVVLLAWSLTRQPISTLRWDGQTWHVAASGSEPTPGEVQVAIDLGSWMLLRFTPSLPAARRGGCWLPLQRRGLELQWHALRCAVYSPRPPLDEDSPDGF